MLGAVAYTYNPAPWEAEAGLGHLSRLSQKYFKNFKKRWGLSSLAECLPRRCEALGSMPSTVKQINVDVR